MALERPLSFQDEYDDPVALTDPVMAGVPAPEVSHDEPEDEIVWDEDPPPVPTPAKPSKPTGRVDAVEDLASAEIAEAATSPARPPRARPKGLEPKVTEPARVVAATPGRTLAETISERRNPLILMAVGLLVIGTVAFRTWRARVADLPLVAERGKTEGIAALDDGKFQLARQILSEAKRAVIALGDAYEGAAAIKRGADEAAVFADLDPGRLEEMLDEASRADPKDWEKTFATLYKNRYVLIDTQIKSVPDSRGAGSYELFYRVLPDGGDGETPPSSGRVDLNGFRLFDLTPPRRDERVIFGARVVSFVFDKDKEEWIIGLDPDSGVTITHEKALQKLGWPDGTEASAEVGR